MPLQQALYEHFLLSNATRRLLAGSKASGVLSAITCLKKLCNHPKLIYDTLHSKVQVGLHHSLLAGTQAHMHTAPRQKLARSFVDASVGRIQHCRLDRCVFVCFKAWVHAAVRLSFRATPGLYKLSQRLTVT
jgi:hypothetical protein